MNQSYYSIVVIVCACLTYHLSSKTTPSGANPFVALIVPYSGALMLSACGWLLSRERGSFRASYDLLNRSSLGLAVGIFGIEIGYLMLYRSGINVSVGMVTVEAIVALLLAPAGLLLFEEKLSLVNGLGIVLTLGGIFLVTQRTW